MIELEAKCPKKRCLGYAQASVDFSGSDGEGNTEGPCDTCHAQVAFHYLVEIDGVSLARDDDEN